MVTLIILSFIVCSISFTITVTSIFAPVREWVSKIHPKLEELIHCPYCLGHYIAGLLIYIVDYRFVFVDNWPILNFLLTVFIIMGIVPVMHSFVLTAYEPIAKNMAMRHMQKNKNK